MSLGLEPKFSFLCSVEMQSSWWTRLSIDPSVPLFPQHLPSPCWQLATQRWASCSSCSPGDVTQVPGPHYGPARPRSYNLNEPPHDQFCNHQSTQDPWLGTSQGSPYQFPRNIPAPTAEAPEPGAAATCCRPDACSRQHPNESVRQCCGQLANSRAPLSPA